MIVPPWTPEMQELWNKAMYLQRISTAYGVALPQPETTYKRPAEGSFLEVVLFAAVASPEEYTAFASAQLTNMREWKARIAATPRSRQRPLPAINLDLLTFEL